MLKLVLASQSPRRKELLAGAGFNFIVLPVNISETPDKNLNLDQQILKIAADKAKACIQEYNHLQSQDFLILSADTMVIVDHQCLGKPADKIEAETYLKLLSGRGHLVKTALHMLNCKTFEQVQEITTTEVFFRSLSDQDIHNYIATGEPMDKAGGYGIQGIGATLIDHYLGPHDNVVGLSIESFRRLLTQTGWNVG
jgi:septum formation protein